MNKAIRKFFRYDRKKMVLPLILLIWYGATIGGLMLGAAAFDRTVAGASQTAIDSLKAAIYENLTSDSPEFVLILDQKYSGLGTRYLNLATEYEKIINQSRWAIESAMSFSIIGGEMIFRNFGAFGSESFPSSWMTYNSYNIMNNMVCASASLIDDYTSAKQSGTFDNFKLAHPVGKPLAEECTLAAVEKYTEPVGPWLIIVYAVYLLAFGYVISSAVLWIYQSYEIEKISRKGKKLRRK